MFGMKWLYALAEKTSETLTLPEGSADFVAVLLICIFFLIVIKLHQRFSEHGCEKGKEETGSPERYTTDDYLGETHE